MFTNFRRLTATTLLALTLTSGAFAERYKVDTAHSSVGFTVTHLNLSEVDGRFRDFSGDVVWDPKALARSSIAFTVAAKSVDTDNDQRDEHLRSADFFEVEKYPSLSFQSREITALGSDRYSVKGDLTVHGVTKPITFQANIKGPVDAFGTPSVGFRATFKINRIDYKVGDNWKGGSDAVVGHDVFITVKGEAGKAK